MNPMFFLRTMTHEVTIKQNYRQEIHTYMGRLAKISCPVLFISRNICTAFTLTEHTQKMYLLLWIPSRNKAKFSSNCIANWNENLMICYVTHMMEESVKFG